jgi:hypothetical protein
MCGHENFEHSNVLLVFRLLLVVVGLADGIAADQMIDAVLAALCMRTMTDPLPLCPGLRRDPLPTYNT